MTRLAILILSAAAATLLTAGGKKVSTLIYRFANDSVEITPDAKPIRNATAPSTPARAAVDASPYRRQYANQQLNSRLPGPIPPVGFRVRKEAQLHETLPPDFVLQDGDRILVQGPEWRLFTLTGALVFADRLALGHAVMDAPNGRMFIINSAGYLAARNLVNGMQPYNFLPSFGTAYTRSFIAPRGRRMVIGGFERPRGSHGDFEPSRSMIESFDLGDPPVADSMGFLTTLESKAALTLPAVNMHMAGVGERFVVAIPGHVYLLNANLKVEAAFEADFEPRGLSLDEAGRIYLLARKGNRTQLWLLSAAGERICSLDLHPGADVHHPPILGYDHTAYLIAGNQIIAVGADGKVKWTKTARARIAGAAISTDDQLLVSEGPAVTVYSPAGERSVILTLSQDLRTPPILAQSGEILVASENRLYILEALNW